jgi:hypothetical protein
VPYLPPTPYQQFCPPALTDAAVPLDGVHRLLRALSDDHAGVTGLCDGSPSAEVRDAVDRFLRVYAGASFALSVTAGDLAYNLRLAAESYRGTEQALHDAAMAADPRALR